MTDIPAVVGSPARPAAARRGHTIVCGLSALGVRIIEQLHTSGAPVVVVDEDPDRRRLGLLADWGVACVTGSPRDREALAAAGAAGATAVICVEESDLHALESALAAHELGTGCRIVAQIGNAAVRRALEAVTGPGTVLDVAELAAPSIVAACLGRDGHDLELGGTAFRVVEATCPGTGTLRSLFGDLVPIAVRTPDGGEVVVCPGRDLHVASGDIVSVLGTPAELADRPAGEATTPPELTQGARTAARALVGPLWGEMHRGLRLALLAVVALVAVATAVLRLTYRQPGGRHLDSLSALYFTVETVSTVGFGEFSFAHQGAAMLVFGIALIILGAALVTTIFAMVTDLLVSRSVADALGRGRLTRLRRHVVLVGLGSIGMRVAELLVERGARVVVIERDELNRHAARAAALGLVLRSGNAADPDTLSAANAESASAVAVLTSDDLTNLEVGLVVRDLLRRSGSSAPVVLRLFDRGLSETIGRNLAFRSVRSTSALAAPWFVGSALGLGILSTFFVEQQLFLVARLTVASSGGLAGMSMQELSARIRVVAISRAPDHRFLEHPPRRSTQFAPGDHAYLIGPGEELITVLRRDAVVED